MRRLRASGAVVDYCHVENLCKRPNWPCSRPLRAALWGSLFAGSSSAQPVGWSVGPRCRCGLSMEAPPRVWPRRSADLYPARSAVACWPPLLGPEVFGLLIASCAVWSSRLRDVTCSSLFVGYLSSSSLGPEPWPESTGSSGSLQNTVVYQQSAKELWVIRGNELKVMVTHIVNIQPLMSF